MGSYFALVESSGVELCLRNAISLGIGRLDKARTAGSDIGPVLGCRCEWSISKRAE
jgi:hypothetical protein